MVFSNVIANFNPANIGEKDWSEEYSPHCLAGEGGKCFGYNNLPNEVSCQAVPPEGVQRLCLCMNKGIDKPPFVYLYQVFLFLKNYLESCLLANHFTKLRICKDMKTN